jgi:hypothetical protein
VPDVNLSSADAGAQGGSVNDDSSRAVFINCPYDAEYEPLFDALLFSVVCCGFLPRNATGSANVSVARMDRIFEAIFSSRYSIHDLSRCRGEGEHLLARFNMPLELGIAMARRQADARSPRPHDWLVLVPADAPYSRFISDLAGFDPPHYDGKPESLIRKVVSWLYTREGALVGVKPTPVIEKLESFRKRKAELKAEWIDIPWEELVKAAVENAPRF